MSPRLWALLALTLTACTPPYVTGRASSTVLASIPPAASFIVTVPDIPTLGDQHVAELLSAEMQSRGFLAASDLTKAQLAVAYQLTGTSKIVIQANTTGGSDGRSTTTYTRFLQVWLLDLAQSESEQKPAILWRAEIYSEGMARDLSRVPDYLVLEAFKRFGRNVTNDSFAQSPEPGFQ